MCKVLLESRGAASPKTCRPGPTNFWFDHTTACNKLGVVGVSESNLSVGEVSAYGMWK